MYNISSFYLKKFGKDSINEICFNAFVSHAKSKEDFIIIEYSKLSETNHDDFLYYFNELKKANIYLDEIRDNEKKQRFEITLNFSGSIKSRSLACIAIRFPLEIIEEYDHFYEIYTHFIKMCRYFPDMDRGYILCFSFNLFRTQRNTNRFNGNHCLSYNWSKMINSNDILNIDNNGVANFFQENENIKDHFESPEKVKNYSTKQDYEKAIKFYQEKSGKIIL